MWRLLLLFTFIFLAGCAWAADRSTFESQESQDPELTATREFTPESNTTSLSETEMETMSKLPNLGSAAELTNEVWLNTDRPLRLAELRGQVVLIEMWTFG